MLEATLALVAEVGFTATTVEAVATRAGVGRATIYRRWPSREALLMAAAGELAGPAPAPDTGSLRGDLEEILIGLADDLGSGPAPSVLADIAAEAGRNPELRRLLDAHIHARRQASLEVLERAAARGELHAGTAHEIVIDLLAGAVLYRLTLRASAVDASIIAEILDTVLEGISP